MSHKTTRQVTVSISIENWTWWQKNKWLKLSPMLENAIRKVRNETEGHTNEEHSKYIRGVDGEYCMESDGSYKHIG